MTKVILTEVRTRLQVAGLAAGFSALAVAPAALPVSRLTASIALLILAAFEHILVKCESLEGDTLPTTDWAGRAWRGHYDGSGGAGVARCDNYGLSVT